MKTYYIYHIQGVKIGCSTQPKRRVEAQGYTDFEILEQHTDIDVADRREKELQKQYGYKVDCNSYKIAVANRPKFTNEDRSKGGTTQGRRNVESGLLKANSLKNKENGITKIWSQAGAKATSQKINTCPFCGRNDLKGNIALANHKKHCNLNGQSL